MISGNSSSRKTRTRKRAKSSQLEAQVLEQQVRICKAFAHPTRLRMLDLLGEKERSVAELQKLLAVSKANLSQHLAILKAVGIVATRREGRHFHCSLAIPVVKKACHLIREVLRAQFLNKPTIGF